MDALVAVELRTLYRKILGMARTSLNGPWSSFCTRLQSWEEDELWEAQLNLGLFQKEGTLSLNPKLRHSGIVLFSRGKCLLT